MYIYQSLHQKFLFPLSERLCVCVLWSLPPGYPALPISLLSYCSIPIPCFSSGLPCHSPPPVFFCCPLYSLSSQDPIWKHPMDKFGPTGITAYSHCHIFVSILVKSHRPKLLFFLVIIIKWWWCTATTTGNKLSYVLCLQFVLVSLLFVFV